MNKGKPFNWVLVIGVGIVVWLLLNPAPIFWLLHIIYTIALTTLIVVATVYLLKRM